MAQSFTVWVAREYRRIASATRRGPNIVVHFEDGTSATIEVKSVIPPTREVHWDRMSVAPHEIVIPTADGPIEIPWSTIRALTDREFSAHLATAAEEEARQVGRRLRDLRAARHLTAKEVAERAGITPQSLSRIENGHHDVVFTTLRRILAAMGASLKDLAPEPAALSGKTTERGTGE